MTPEHGEPHEGPPGWDPHLPRPEAGEPASSWDSPSLPRPDAGEPASSWDPLSVLRPDAGYPATGQGWPVPPVLPVQAFPVTAPGAAAARRPPGWVALVSVAAVSALLAAILGGLAGGWLVTNAQFAPAAGSLPTPGPGSTSRPAGSIAGIAARSLPSVVTIKVQGADGSGTGSGFVIDKLGHIITNNHVVAGAARSGRIAVQLSNGDRLEARVVGHDASYDLAVIKVARTGLTPLVMGRSADVVVGDEVIAVGAPLGLDSTVTSGIVSALARPVSPGGGTDQAFINAIQTDAAINPGNSGGPLLDMSGLVIGVNSAIARIPGTGASESGNIGVGFSIPSDQVRKTADQLIRTGKAEHPIIGVALDSQYTGDGVKVPDRASNGQEPVTKGGPAAKAGLRPGDVIIGLDGRRMTSADDLVVAIRAKNVGDKVVLKVRRGTRTFDVTMTLQGATGS